MEADIHIQIVSGMESRLWSGII